MNIKDLREKEAHLSEQLTKIRNAIKALQAVCEHKWEYSGHDSHHDYQCCVDCGLEERA